MYNFPDNPVTGNTVTLASGAVYRFDGTKWTAGTPAGPVTSFNTRTGAVTLSPGDVTGALGYTPYNSGNPSNYQTGTQVTNTVNNYVALAGSVMNGLLTLSGNPSAPLHAATKQYVDGLQYPIVVTTTGSVGTSSTTEVSLAPLRIPAGTMGANGMVVVHVLFTYPNNSNTKTIQARFSATSGAVSGGPLAASTPTTTTNTQLMWIVRNINSVSVQQSYNSPSVPFGALASGPLGAAVNTANDAYFNLNGFVAVGTDTLTLAHAMMIIYPHA